MIHLKFNYLFPRLAILIQIERVFVSLTCWLASVPFQLLHNVLLIPAIVKMS